MALVGFKKRSIAQRLHSIAVEPPIRTGSGFRDPNEYTSVSWIFFTPSAGIAAFTDASPYADQDIPEAECDTWLIYRTESGNVRRREVLNTEGTVLKTKVANMAPAEIEGSTFIGATQYAGGIFLANYAPNCP